MKMTSGIVAPEGREEFRDPRSLPPHSLCCPVGSERRRARRGSRAVDGGQEPSAGGFRGSPGFGRRIAQRPGRASIQNSTPPASHNDCARMRDTFLRHCDEAPKSRVRVTRFSGSGTPPSQEATTRSRMQIRQSGGGQRSKRHDGGGQERREVKTREPALRIWILMRRTGSGAARVRPTRIGA